MFLLPALAAALFFAGPAPERGTLQGEVAVESVGTSGVAIFVDTNGDASFDHRFMLEDPACSPDEFSACFHLKAGKKGTRTFS